MTTRGDIWFVIPAFRPDESLLSDLFASFAPHPVVCVFPKDEHVLLPKGVGMPLAKNFGYGGNANAGIRHALEKGAAWVVVCNQDIQVTKGDIAGFVRQLNGDSGIAGPSVGQLDANRWTTTLENIDSTEYVSGAFIAINRAVFAGVGLFHEPYFMYYEDADYCIAATKKGFSLKNIRMKSLSHSDSSSLGRGSLRHEYYLARNHLLFVERQAPVRVKLHELARLPKTIAEHQQRGNSGALLGVQDYLFRRFGSFETHHGDRR